MGTKGAVEGYVAPALSSFLETLAERNFGAMRELFATNVRLRALVPSGPREVLGRVSAADELRSWFGSAETFEVVDSRAERVADRWHVVYRLSLERGNGRELVEQHCFCDVGPEGIESIDLVCSGFRPAARGVGSVHEFDAGDMGCADGLPQELRRRVGAVPVGETLVVVARDPAAKEDLPPLVRMMGHKVLSVETHDGCLEITVEVGK